MESVPSLHAALADRYLIEREIGAGGMARVYLAQDLRHDRRVALKVLRPELAAVIGAARFLAEIRTTANLQHPHILPLYDSGEADGSVFYVMPFVPGESLRERLARETQLPVGDAVRIAGEVADALDYAHRQGVVHRDIKPENILLQDGRALIADFGIALAVSRVDGASRMTETGMSLGTPHYMSPEQAMGEREIGARSDVYALGCVLYEMLTGEPPFTGPSAQAIVARVVTEAPRSIVAQRRSVPLHVEQAVHRALEKLPADRFETAAAFATALRDPGRVTVSASEPVQVQRRRSRTTTLLGTLALVFAALAAWGWLRPEPAKRVVRYTLFFEDSAAADGLVELGASGAMMVYGGPGSATRPLELWIKHRDQFDPVVIPGTRGVNVFAISPDEQSLAFIANTGGDMGPLRRQSISGGAAVTIADSVLGMGVAWLRDGNVVFTRVENGGYVLWRVPAAGGVGTRLWQPDSTAALVLPHEGPDGQVLVTRVTISDRRETWVVDARTGEARLLLNAGMNARWLESGHIVYGRADGALLAVEYDARRRQTRGESVPLLDNVEVWFGMVPIFSVTRQGTLVARLGEQRDGVPFQPEWVDRTGRGTVIDSAWSFNPITPSFNVGWSLSPDGSQMAVGIASSGQSGIWVKRLPTGTLSRLTFDNEPAVRPRWSPDGKAVMYLRGADATRMQLWEQQVSGVGGDSLLLNGHRGILEAVWSRDREWLVVRTGNGATEGRDIMGMRPGVDTALRPLVATRHDESAVALSPDMKWIAYQSDETGTPEVFVRPFPNTDGGKWQASVGGGLSPLWNPRGGELFYVNTSRQMMAVSVGSGASPELGERRTLFTLSPEHYGGSQEYYTPHDVSPDGERFLMLRVKDSGPGTRRLVMVENVLANGR